MGPVLGSEAQLGGCAGRTNWWLGLHAALPDPFWDTPTVDVAASTAQPLWIEIDVPRDAVAGEYTGTLTLRWDNGSVNLPLRLTVWDFELPATRHQQVTNWFTFPGAGYHVEHDSAAFWELAAKYAKIMVAHRQTCFKAELGWIKTTFDPQHGYQCDFRFLDRWAETFFAAGMERMELFQAGTISASVDNPAARIGPANLAVEVKVPGVQLTAEEKLRGVLEQLDRHVREKNWANRVMIHVQDEPFLHCVPTYKQVAELVHRAAPSLKIVEAVEATGFGEAIDVLVPKLNHLNLWLPHFQEMQGQGKEVWFYTCCHPVGRYPNRFLDQPLVKTRVLHWMSYLYDLDGYLHWGLNYFAAGADPYSEEGVSKDLPLGDRAIMYPGRNGPVGSLRWSAMRDGLQDYELLRVLESRLASLKQSRGDRADWLDPRQRPLELCRRVAASFYDYTRAVRGTAGDAARGCQRDRGVEPISAPLCPDGAVRGHDRARRTAADQCSWDCRTEGHSQDQWGSGVGRGCRRDIRGGLFPVAA